LKLSIKAISNVNSKQREQLLDKIRLKSLFIRPEQLSKFVTALLSMATDDPCIAPSRILSVVALKLS